MGNYRGSDPDPGATAPANSLCVRGHRLSKPRTSSSSLSPNASTSRLDLLTLSGSAKTSPSASHSSPHLLVPSPADGIDADTGRRDSRQKLREHLFGPDAAAGDERAVEEAPESSEDERRRGPARSIRHRFAKRPSLRLTFPGGKAHSTTSLVREPSVGAVAEDETRVVARIKEKAHADQLLAYHQEGSERHTSPFRRRSLLTPGLATRHPSDILRKPPPPPPPPGPPVAADDDASPAIERAYYYDPQRSESSPLARLAALDLARAASPALTRCGTPASLDYGHLAGAGAALRVTNGVASPAPSARSRRRHPTLPDTRALGAWGREEGVSVAEEGPRSPAFEGPRSPASPTRTAVLHETHRRGDEIAPSSPSGDAGARREIVRRKPSALRYEREALERAASQRAREYRSELPDSPFKERPGSRLSFVATSKPSAMEDDLFEAQSVRSSVALEDSGPSVRSSVVTVEETVPSVRSSVEVGEPARSVRSSVKARKPVPPAPAVDSVADPAANTPASFVDEALGMNDGPFPLVTKETEDWSRPLPTPVARLGYQYEPKKQTQQPQQGRPEQQQPGQWPQQTRQGQRDPQQQGLRPQQWQRQRPVTYDASRPPPSPVATRQSTFDSQQTVKSDSGYSSGSSLCSLQMQPPTARHDNPGRSGYGERPVSEHWPLRRKPVGGTYPLTASNEIPAPSRDQLAATNDRPAISIDTSAASAKSGSSLDAPRSSTERSAPSIDTPASSIEPHSPLARKPATPNVRPALATTASASSAATARKLQKARPVSLPPPAARITVQCQRAINTHIPAIPAAVAARNAARMQDCPPLQHTLPSVDHATADPDEVGPVSAPLRFPSPFKPGEREKLRKHASLAQLALLAKPNWSLGGPVFRSAAPKGPPGSGGGSGSRPFARGHQHDPTLASTPEDIADALDYGAFSPPSSRPAPRHHPRTAPAGAALRLADLGDVAAALGSSPYDAARAGPAPWVGMPPLTAMHPYQLGRSHAEAAAAARPQRPARGMSEMEAAELSRRRARAEMGARRRGEVLPWV